MEESGGMKKMRVNVFSVWGDLGGKTLNYRGSFLFFSKLSSYSPLPFIPFYCCGGSVFVSPLELRIT